MKYTRKLEKEGVRLYHEVMEIRAKNARLCKALQLANDANRAHRASERVLQRQIDDQAKEIDRLRDRATRPNRTEYNQLLEEVNRLRNQVSELRTRVRTTHHWLEQAFQESIKSVDEVNTQEGESGD